VNIKTTILLVLFYLVGVSGTYATKTKNQLWFDLSVATQNLQHTLLVIVGPDTMPNYGMHEKELQKIDEILDSPVEVGELYAKRIDLIPLNGESKDKYDTLYKKVKTIGESYGMFVAAEMCDIGAKRRFIAQKPNEPVVLNLRLPKPQMELFMEEMKRLELLKN
jgi:hypothetical protein